MKEFLRVIRPLWQYPGFAFVLILVSLYWGLVSNVSSIVVKNITNAVVAGDWSTVSWFLWIMMGIFTVNVLSSIGRKYCNMKLGKNIEEGLNRVYLSSFFVTDNNYQDLLGTGRSISILQAGVGSWTNNARMLLRRGIEISVSITTALGIIAYMYGWVGFSVTLGVMLIASFLTYIGNKKTGNARKNKRDAIIEKNRYVIRSLMTKQETLYSDNTQREIDRINAFYNTRFSRAKVEWRSQMYTQDVTRWLINVLRIGMLFYIGYHIIYTKQFTVGHFTLFWMMSNNIMSQIQDLTEYGTNYAQDAIHIRKLRETYDNAPRMIGYDLPRTYVSGGGKIVFDSVTFGYESDLLQDFSLHIPAQQKTALVGISGAGKSTIVKLIAGYLHPKAGTVYVDDQQLPHPNNLEQAVSLKSYYPHVGYLTQEPNVFDGTIRENLLYATTGSDTSDEQLHAVLEQAQCQFVYDFTQGLDTEIGEKGIRLSGGQRQRLAIAKIMLKNPHIVLLDEPTSALDSISEEAITKALDNLFQGRTVVIVAHRLQTVKKADEIIVLDKGVIVERGSHDALLAMGGQYAKMLELQSGF